MSRAVIGLAVVVAVLFGLNAVGMNIVGRDGRHENTVLRMPKAKHVSPNADGRTYAVIQICWRPGSIVGSLAYRIGSIDQTDEPTSPACMTPYTRKGLVSPGDLVAMHWAFEHVNAIRGISVRITVNNKVVVEPEPMLDSIGGVTYTVTGLE